MAYFMQIPGSTSMDKNDEPGWAPLRDNYMLTSSKLKDWDKKTVRIDDEILVLSLLSETLHISSLIVMLLRLLGLCPCSWTRECFHGKFLRRGVEISQLVLIS